MGTTIKLHIEIKINGKWLHWNHPRLPQDYEFFTKIANLRPDDYDVEPVSEPKGLPQNITRTVEIHYQHWKNDTFGESWLNSKEIAEVRRWYDARRKYEFGEFDKDFGFLMEHGFDIFEFPEEIADLGVEDVRFIFWFI